MAVTHAFASAKSDGADATLVRPSNWNAAHLGSSRGALRVKDYGAVGDGSTDDAAAIQAALDAAGVGGEVWFEALTYLFVTKLKFYSNQRLIGMGAGMGSTTPKTILSWWGGTGAMMSSDDTAVNHFNVTITDILFRDWDGTADICLDLTKVSTSRIERCGFQPNKTTCIGILLDATSGDYQCYFNLLLENFYIGGGVGLQIQNQANGNVIIDNHSWDCAYSMKFLSGAVANSVIGSYFEQASVGHIYLDSYLNKFLFNHFEGAPCAFAMTANAYGTVRFGNSGSTITAWVSGESNIAGDNPMSFGSDLALGSASIHSGTGSPEGVVTAQKGSQFLRTDGGANTSFYIKESGTGNTGWTAK